MMNVQINQVGYKPADYKTATFRIGDTMSVSDSANSEKKSGDTFRVINTLTDEVIYEGDLTPQLSSKQNGEVNQTADFSEVRKPGKYVIEGENGERSYEFEIADNVYDKILKSSMKMFYLQRCGCSLDAAFAGKYAHPECHDKKARIHASYKYMEVSGGWHDAGDYGRYIVAAAKTVVDLMMAYEFYPEAVGADYISDDTLSSEDAVYECAGPEIFEEIKYELDWMLKMQNKETGGVYHKVTCASFPGFVMPEYETEELIISPVSDAATADFAAAMAYASRFYDKASEIVLKSDGNGKDKAVEAARALAYKTASEKYMSAAESAMGYLENNSTGGFTNPKGVVTGEYGDDCTADEYYWAYAEMFKTTGDRKYEDAMKAMDLETVPGDFGWKEVGDYAFYAYLTADYDKDEELYNSIYKRFEDEAVKKMANFTKDPYGASVYGNFYWGCNMEIADNARRGIILDKLNGSSIYKDMVDAQLNYLLGNNPNAKCYVTGFGKNPPRNPHHRPSVAMKSAMPGMLVGGPEPGLLDDVAKGTLNGRPPAKCYLDNTDSYSTNEITIYWNSPLVFLLAYAVSK